MKCPVCKSRLKNTYKCHICGFDLTDVEFLNIEEAEEWKKNTLEPYCMKYYQSNTVECEEYTICHGKYMYKGANSHICIPLGVTSISRDAFSKCKKLTSVVIPESVSSIGAWAFYECNNLQSISIPSSVRTIGVGAFYHCNNLESIVLPPSINRINDETFDGCIGLTQIRIPEKVDVIGNFAFLGCKNLKHITFATKSVEFGYECFARCDGLADENGFIIIDGILFGYIGQKPEVRIPSSVWKIGSQAFSYNEQVISIILPDSIKQIECDAFFSCRSLSSLYFLNRAIDISDKAIKLCENVTIYSPRNSNAARYANQYSFKWYPLFDPNLS